MSQNVQSPTSPKPISKGRSLARKIVLVALIIHFFSLFLPYQDDTSSGQLFIDSDFNTVGHYQIGLQEQTGLKLRPFAPLILITLFIIYATSLHRRPFWDRFGYWLTIPVVLIGAMGGALVRTSGGNLTILTFLLICLAAVINWIARKQRPAL